MRNTMIVPTLRMLFMRVIIGVYWYMPPNAEVSAASQQGSRLRRVCAASSTTGRQVLNVPRPLFLSGHMMRSATKSMAITASSDSSSCIIKNCE